MTKYGAKGGSTPAKATPAKACFVYGDGENGSPISTYASNSPFPSSVENFISGLLPLTNVTIATSSLLTGQAETTSSSAFPATGATGSTTSVLSQTTAKADTTTTKTNPSSQAVGKAASISPSPLIITTSAPISLNAQSSTTPRPITSAQKSAVEGTRPPIAVKVIPCPQPFPGLPPASVRLMYIASKLRGSSFSYSLYPSDWFFSKGTRSPRIPPMWYLRALNRSSPSFAAVPRVMVAEGGCYINK